MKIPLYQVDAFADAPFQGNPAAVCPLDEWLPDELLQSIAEENNLSETAFYVPKKEFFELRWFTPTSEVDLCGHATMAAACVVFRLDASIEGQMTFESRSGLLHVTQRSDLLTLDFPSQAGVVCETPEALIEGLGATPAACCRAMDYMAVFDSEEEIRAISPDFRRLRDLDLRGVIITAPGREVDFVSRFFAPSLGVDEDPVTGSAHCTLAPYWSDRLGRNELRARQLSKRAGQLWCRVEGTRVFISGRAAFYLEGTIALGDSAAAKPVQA